MKRKLFRETWILKLISMSGDQSQTRSPSYYPLYQLRYQIVNKVQQIEHKYILWDANHENIRDQSRN